MVPPCTKFLSPKTWVILDDHLSLTPHIQSISQHIKSSPNISQICPFLYPHIYYSSQVSTMSPHHSFNNTLAATPHCSPYSDHGYIIPWPKIQQFFIIPTNKSELLEGAQKAFPPVSPPSPSSFLFGVFVPPEEPRVVGSLWLFHLGMTTQPLLPTPHLAILELVLRLFAS